jgi:hypothetical protein
MINGFLGTIWYLWVSNVIQADVVTRALTLEGYELEALTKEGIVASKENETFEFHYGKKI